MTTSTGTIPARYTDTDEACLVAIEGEPIARFTVCGRLVYRLSPDHCEDGGRLIRSDVPGAFGNF